MDARAIIAQIRRGDTPSDDELRWFSTGLATGAVSDAQAGAFAMAVCLNGLSEEGRVALTTGMRDSGRVMTWDLPGAVVDKHSTGGVGDPVSLILAPALAACGVFVPMVSGRGLGHTGGTLDKLEAIPGLSCSHTIEGFRKITREVGCAIVSATDDIAPADKRLYAIRDVSSTVESVDLICASILSKKLAAGLGALVLDVKCGSGAFMKTRSDAEGLARALSVTANGAGTPSAAMITDMSQPLAPALGNALEVAISLEVLSGNRAAAPRLHDLTVALGARVLALSGQAEGEAEERLKAAIASGHAMACFSAMVRAMGGPADLGAQWRKHLPKAPVICAVPAPLAGWIRSFDAEGLGHIVVTMGGGRRVESDKIDPRVGLSDILPIGTYVAQGDPIACVHAADAETAAAATQSVLRAITIGERPAWPDLILQRIDP